MTWDALQTVLLGGPRLRDFHADPNRFARAHDARVAAKERLNAQLAAVSETVGEAVEDDDGE